MFKGVPHPCLVTVRVGGSPAAVAHVAAELRRTAPLQFVSESMDYPNHEGPGVHRYLTITVLTNADRVSTSEDAR